MVNRNIFKNLIKTSFEINPIVAILGPRQCGKTTIAKEFKQPAKANYFDLENPLDLTRLADPILALEKLEGLIIIDEIQRKPELFTTLRYLIDNNKNQQYLILGSASRELIKQSSESLAGRISYVELTPFTRTEITDTNNLWLKGGFPKAYLAKTEILSSLWRNSYIKTFFEQDIPNLGINIPAQQLQRFWSMLAHSHGNILNASELGGSLGISHNTVRNYIDILCGTFMIRELKPWTENIKKRQVKLPKIYFRDSGLYHSLLRIESNADLLITPKLGASWEGFALEQILNYLKLEDPLTEGYFWATHAGAELDLLIIQKNKKLGFEFKYSSTPTLTKSMKIAKEDLHLDQLFVVYPGNLTFELAHDIIAIGFDNYFENN